MSCLTRQNIHKFMNVIFIIDKVLFLCVLCNHNEERREEYVHGYPGNA